jgi:hypothetical protein
MSRFYSNYEIWKQDKMLNEDNLLSSEKFKTDLKSAIDRENHRVNIDSAKKKAVLQRMDYDGFHQMVLGADLKGIKGSDVINIKPTSGIMNSTTNQRRLGEEVDVFGQVFSKKDEKVGTSSYIENQLINDESSLLAGDWKTFEKTWKNSKSVDEKITILQNYYENNKTFNMILSSMPSGSLETSLFIDFIFTIGSYLENNKNSNLTKFLVDSLNSLVNIPDFSKLKKFLGKKHKAPYLAMQENKESYEDLFSTNFESLLINIL